MPNLFPSVYSAQPFIQRSRRECSHLYFYFMDRGFGLMHVRVQNGFPLQIEIDLNGHEWIARKLTAHGVRYTNYDHASVWIENMARAHRFVDRFANLKWPAILNLYGKRIIRSCTIPCAVARTPALDERHVVRVNPRRILA